MKKLFLMLSLLLSAYAQDTRPKTTLAQDVESVIVTGHLEELAQEYTGIYKEDSGAIFTDHPTIYTYDNRVSQFEYVQNILQQKILFTPAPTAETLRKEIQAELGGRGLTVRDVLLYKRYLQSNKGSCTLL